MDENIEKYSELRKEAETLYQSAILEMNQIFDSNKYNSIENLGTLRDLIIASEIRKQFVEKYPPTNYTIKDIDGNIHYVFPKLDSDIFKMYLDIIGYPKKLIESIHQ